MSWCKCKGKRWARGACCRSFLSGAHAEHYHRSLIIPKIWLLIHHVSVQGMPNSAFLKRCANCNRCMRYPTVIGAPHGLDMTTLTVKMMNTLLHTQPGNLTKEVGLLHTILLPMDVQCQGRQISQPT